MRRTEAAQRDTVGKAVFLPEVAFGEGVAGTVIEIAFEGLGFLPVREIDGDDEFPRRELAGMWRFTGIVFSKAFLKVAGETDVSLVWLGVRA